MAIEEFQIAKLALEAGDILVIKGDTAPHKCFDIGHILPPNVRVLYIPSDMELSVLTKAEIDARAVK